MNLYERLRTLYGPFPVDPRKQIGDGILGGCDLPPRASLLVRELSGCWIQPDLGPPMVLAKLPSTGALPNPTVSYSPSQL